MEHKGVDGHKKWCFILKKILVSMKACYDFSNNKNP